MNNTFDVTVFNGSKFVTVAFAVERELAEQIRDSFVERHYPTELSPSNGNPDFVPPIKAPS